MSLDTTTLRVESLLHEMFLDAYGGPQSPAVYLCECGHPDSVHEGEDWEGPCTVEGCDCQERVDADQ